VVTENNFRKRRKLLRKTISSTPTFLHGSFTNTQPLLSSLHVLRGAGSNCGGTGSNWQTPVIGFLALRLICHAWGISFLHPYDFFMHHHEYESPYFTLMNKMIFEFNNMKVLFCCMKKYWIAEFENKKCL